MSKVNSASELQKAWLEASQYDDRVLAERYIQGTEFTVSIVDNQALPVIGLQTSHDFYDYSAKYVTGDTRYLLPSGLNDQQQLALQELALSAYRAVGCEGWGRVDIMLDEQQQPWLLEVNTSPGMTDMSLVPQAAAYNGMSFQELVLKLVSTARLKVFSGH
jgi:D-alanine-D-alanine ligase